MPKTQAQQVSDTAAAQPEAPQKDRRRKPDQPRPRRRRNWAPFEAQAGAESTYFRRA